MKKLFTLMALALAAFGAQAQTYPYVSITDINFVSQTDLLACNDSSAYLGDTIRTRAIVVTDGGMTEVASGSVQGGLRPFIHVVDTANGGAPLPFSGIEVMGVIEDAGGNLIPHPNFIYVAAGDVVEITGIVGVYNNGNQLSLLDANSFNIISSGSAPADTSLAVGELNDPNRVNILPTGEQWENTFVELKDVTVTEVDFFSGGTRVSFNVVDANGNKINVSDRYAVQKLPSYQIINTNSPYHANQGGPGTGTFVAPVPGTFYNSIKGMIRHDGNGCLTNSGVRGYEINPFDESHYDLGYAPPYISNVERDPAVPTSNQSPDITLNLTDFDGTVATKEIYYSADPALAPASFPGFALNAVPGTTDEFEFTLPNYPNNTLVRYYIKATDNDGNVSYYPSTPLNQNQPNVEFYTVRDGGIVIPDIQYTPYSNGNSPYVGKEVTVTGIVTASTKDYDLGFVYIQDPDFNEWAGLTLVGGSDLATLFRNEEVTVTGTIEEYFGLTRMNVFSAVKTGNLGSIAPTVVNPGDSAFKASGEIEKYESMLVSLQNPTTGAKVHISDDNRGFGDYSVGNTNTASYGQSILVLAGRQSSTAFSSLWVQIVSDTVYANIDGEMEVDPIKAETTMNMDALVGLLSYGFSNYRVLPRNNDDFVGINVTLDTTNLPTSPISVEEIPGMAQVRFFPNPAREYLQVELSGNGPFELILSDLSGRTVLTQPAGEGRNQINMSVLPAGMYLLQVVSPEGRTPAAKVIKPAN